MGPDDGAAFDADPVADTSYSIFQRQAPREERKEGTKPNDAGLAQRAFARADQLFPHIQVFGGHADMCDIHVGATDVHIFQMGKSAFGVGEASFHHFTRANTVVQVIFCFHAGVDQPIYHLRFDGWNVG